MEVKGCGVSRGMSSGASREGLTCGTTITSIEEPEKIQCLTINYLSLHTSRDAQYIWTIYIYI